MGSPANARSQSLTYMEAFSALSASRSPVSSAPEKWCVPMSQAIGDGKRSTTGWRAVLANTVTKSSTARLMSASPSKVLSAKPVRDLAAMAVSSPVLPAVR